MEKRCRARWLRLRLSIPIEEGCLLTPLATLEFDDAGGLLYRLIPLKGEG